MVDNVIVQQLCKEENVGFVNLWESVVANEEVYMRGTVHEKWPVS